MTKSYKSLAAICAMAIMTAGCTNSDSSGSNSNSSHQNSHISSSTDESSSSGIYVEPPEKAPIGSDEILSEKADCNIEFSGSGISVTGSGAFVSSNFVTIQTEGVYHLSGNAADAKILVLADKSDKITLVLNGLSLTSSDGPAIDCEEAGELIICTAKDTENSLSDSGKYTLEANETEPDAAVFCRSDLTLSGEGKLIVNGVYNDAIKCKDNLQIINGIYDVSSESDGIVGKDSVKIFDGDITVNAGKDGIKSSQDNDTTLGFVTINGGNITINSEHDGIQAETKLSVYGGNIKIVSGGDKAYEEITASNNDNPGGRPFGGDWGMRGGNASSSSSSESTESLKGLKAGGDIEIYNRDTVIDITSADDAVHSNANVKISDGQLTLSSCDDAIHADELLTIDNGILNITKSYEGLEAKSIAINGGDIDLIAVDDGMNSAGGDNGDYFGFDSGSDEYYISISGGDITVNADGDGIDSNGNVALSGGRLVIYGPTNSGNGALDYGTSFAVSGGELIALGSAGMAQAPSTLSQPCISITSNVQANSTIEVKSADGEVIMSVVTPKACQSLIFSSYNFTEGNDYSIYANGTLLETVTAKNGVSGNGSNGGGMGGMQPGGMGGGNMQPGGGMGRR